MPFNISCSFPFSKKCFFSAPFFTAIYVCGMTFDVSLTNQSRYSIFLILNVLPSRLRCLLLFHFGAKPRQQCFVTVSFPFHSLFACQRIEQLNNPKLQSTECIFCFYFCRRSLPFFISICVFFLFIVFVFCK